SLRVEDGDGEVLALARLLGVRGLVHGGADLDRDRLQRAPHDTQRDGIEPRRAHLMTSSARASRIGEMDRPSVRAVLRFITSSNFVGCSIGSSAGCAPL